MDGIKVNHASAIDKMIKAGLYKTALRRIMQDNPIPAGESPLFPLLYRVHGVPLVEKVPINMISEVFGVTPRCVRRFIRRRT
jgi:hypothetical protein